MAKIFYSCSGEGRGHASRARTIIEDLKDKHDITVYAPEHAYDMLHPLYKKSNVLIRKIPGLIFHYNEFKKLDYLKTVVRSVEYLFNRPALVDIISDDIERENPDLIVTDFEPALPKAAEKCGRNYVSIDHQHFLTSYDLSALPLHLQQMAAAMASTVNLFYMRQAETIVSAFYFPPVKKNLKRVHQVGVFLNSHIREITPHKGEHILVYMRRHLDDMLLRSLENSGHPVIIYTNEFSSNYKNITFKKISPNGFIDDLASCQALVSTAGNQLVGEALYLGKPVFTMPEPGNFEQEINGHFLSCSGAGENHYLHTINEDSMKVFMQKADMYAGAVDPNSLIGNYKTYSVLDKYLNPAKVSGKDLLEAVS